MSERSFSWHGYAILVTVTMGLCLVGCGESKGPTGTVQGKVTFEGEPAPEGAMIMFLGADDPTASASTEIAAGGEYSLPSGIPVGKYRVSISPPVGEELSPEQAMMQSESAGGAGEGSDAYPNIPQKYRNPANSPETCEIKEGDNTYNLDMTK